jgi:hypothetical protein
MARLLILSIRVTFYTYITVAGFLYFGPIGLAPLCLWMWSRRLERRHG